MPSTRDPMTEVPHAMAVTGVIPNGSYQRVVTKISAELKSYLSDSRPSQKTCKAKEGLVEEGEEIIGAKAEPEVRDAGLIAAAQKVEHYEIVGYGCLATWADQLSMGEVKRLLGETLEEEKQADHLLNQIAEQQINAQSASR